MTSSARPASRLFVSLWHGVALAVAGISLTATSAEAGASITWRVENSFRFFTDPADTEVHRATYLALKRDEKSTPVLSEERALQSRQPDGWAATMFRKTCWTGNEFKCDTYDDYINPASHAVVAKVAGVDDAANLTCTWIRGQSEGEIKRQDPLVQPCSEPAKFIIPYPGGTKISVEIGGLQVAETNVKVRDILIAAMGDSFASGEGNPDMAVRFSRERAADYSTPGGFYADLDGYPARVGPWRDFGDKAFIKENARWHDQACHRSLYSEQMRAALQLAIEDPHRAVTYVGVSCAGAEVTAGLFLRYKGNEWVPNPPKLSQISAVAEAQCGAHDTEALDLPEAYHINGQIPELQGGLVLRKCPQEKARKIDLVLVSIGGNDIGFSRLLANAVLSNESLLRQLGGWLGEVHGEAEASDQLSHLGARYKSLNRALHNILYMPWQQSDRVLLVAYPGLALEGDGSETCKDGHAGMEVVPDFQLSESKLRLGTWFADKLHRLMRESADAYGWTFVETHRRSFIGRGVCAGLSTEGVSVVDDLRLPRKVDGAWKPYNPADFQPYASRQRWFRTPNDAFMTANFHVAAGLLTKVLKFEPFAPFQLVLASTYSGAFHPTAEGQAAIADAVANKARAVLAKYGQGPDPDPVTGESPDSEDAHVPPVAEPGRELPDVKAILKAQEAIKPAPSASAQPATPAPGASDTNATTGTGGGSTDGGEEQATTGVVSSAPVEGQTPAQGPAVTQTPFSAISAPTPAGAPPAETTATAQPSSKQPSSAPGAAQPIAGPPAPAPATAPAPTGTAAPQVSPNAPSPSTTTSEPLPPIPPSNPPAAAPAPSADGAASLPKPFAKATTDKAAGEAASDTANGSTAR